MGGFCILKKLEKIIKKYDELLDLTNRHTDEDEDTPCFFSTYSKYEKKDMIGTYHKHDFTIQINHHRLWICKKHFELLSQVFGDVT